MNPQQQLALLIPLALVAPLLPTIGEPFLWFEAYFHEASKVFAVFAAGGTPLEFRVEFGGRSGTEFRGASEAFVLIVGYLGAVFWSLCMFVVPSRVSPWMSRLSAFAILMFVSVCWPLWGVGGDTLAIALTIDAIIIGIFYFRHLGFVANIGKFLAVLLCLSGPRLSVMNMLTEQQSLADDIGAALLTSPIAIVAIWSGLSIMAIAVMFALEAASAARATSRI